MKVQHKDKHYIVGDVFQETATHYLVYLSGAVDSDSPCYAYPKACYEPVPTEPRWQDVTGECDVLGETHLRHVEPNCSNSAGCWAYRAVPDDYRLRKVLVYLAEGLLPAHCIPNRMRWAFLVERK